MQDYKMCTEYIYRSDRELSIMMNLEKLILVLTMIVYHQVEPSVLI